VVFAFEHHDIQACCHIILFLLISPPYARTGQAHAFPVPLCTSCADMGLTAQGSAAIIDLTRDSPRANDSPSAPEIEELMDSSEQHGKTRDMPAKHLVIACSFLHISVLLPSLLLFTAFCPLFSPLLFSPLALMSQHT